jgi:phospholipase C
MAEPEPETALSKVEHIVHVMFENRSLDNVLGWLYWTDDPKTRNRPKVNIPPFPEGRPPVYYGLEEKKYFNTDKEYTGPQYVTRGTSGYGDVPSPDPYEEYQHVNKQLFGSEANPPKDQVPTMGGFLADYYTAVDSALQILQTYTPEELPIINGIAKSYAVSDRRYSSIPTQTNCNRGFAGAGTSLGWVNNHFGPWYDPFELVVTFDTNTVWNTLSANGHGSTADWGIFYSETWHDGYCFTRDLLPKLQPAAFDAHFAPIDTFFDNVETGKLPAYSFLEPQWCLKKFHVGTNGNDYHPPANLGPGELFLNRIYSALVQNPAQWEKTLLIVTFDEHGGTYDHVPPPWGAQPPWGDGKAPYALECKFGFDRFGVRVPTILASPYIDEQVVFRSAKEGFHYDHTSVLATILDWFRIDRSQWNLGARTAVAPTFEGVLARKEPRKIAPLFTPGPFSQRLELAIDAPLTNLQRDIAQRNLHYIHQRRLSGGELRALAARIIGDCRTQGELDEAMTRYARENSAS